MSLHFYSFGGLSIASDLLLPDWPAIEVPGGSVPDVVISTQDTLDDPAIARRSLNATTNDCRLALPGVGIFRIRDGREILIEPVPNASQTRLRAWVTGAAWGALCYQRGLLLLHASAVEVRGRAVIFCGPVGSGKSTMAAEFSRRNFLVISDDLCLVDVPSEGMPVVYPSASRLRLRADSVEALQWRTSAMGPDLERGGKFHVMLPQNPVTERLPLAAIYLLGWGDFNIQRLSGFVAWRRFLSASTYRPRLFSATVQMDDYFKRSLDVLGHIPVWELQRPRGLGASGLIVDQLTGHFAECNIIEQ